MKLKNIKLIGQGSFAIVYLVQDLITGKFYAKKVVETTKMNPLEYKLFSTEKSILRTSLSYNFKNIVKLHRVEKEPSGRYNLILDYCNGGSLHDCLYNYINRFGKPFSENIVRYLMKQILIGVECLHNFGIIHRDLKLGNILINYKNENDRINLNILSSEIKITDFNASYYPNKSEPKTAIGTIPNMAPEVIKKHVFTQVKECDYDNKIDIWSLGTICYEMLFGKPLFSNEPNYENFNNIINANFNIPKTISPQARSFLYCMLQKDGINRLSCSQLLNTEFIKGNFYNAHTLDYNNNIPKINHYYKQKNHEFIQENFYNEHTLDYNNNIPKINHYYKQKNHEFIQENFNNAHTLCYNNNIPKINHYYKQKTHDFIKENIFIEQHLNNNNISIMNHSYNQKFINIVFEDNKGKNTVASVDENTRIKDVIKLYFDKIKRSDLIYNYNKYIKFISNGKDLKDNFNNTVKNTHSGFIMTIHVMYLKDVLGS